jgi:hypothetical protein
MKSKQLSRRVAGVVAAAVALATMAIFQGYGAPHVESPAPPPGARCDAPQLRPTPGQTAVLAQIRYDSGRVLRYCGLQSMFAQLGALEQPGLVRAVHVLTGDGEWIDARQASYVRGLDGVRLAHGAGGAVVFSYAQLLRACARGGCGA